MPQKINRRPLPPISCWLLVSAFCLLVLHQAVFFRWTSDDAYISFRYAEHFSTGRGLTFNPGERVEGYSNFLWVCLLAGFNAAGISPVAMSKFLSFFFSVCLLFTAFRTAGLYGGSPFASGTAAAALACSSGLAYYAMSGLETVFYAFLLTSALYLNKKYQMHLSVKTYVLLYTVLFTAAFTRPEGILFPAAAAVFHLIERLLLKKGPAFKAVLGIPAAGFLLYGCFLVFRFSYYGNLFPNTFYAKPAGTFVSYAGNAFVDNFLNGFFSGSFFLFTFIFLVLWKRAVRLFLFPLLLCACQVLFMSYAGDWMAFGRFFLPILPVTLVLSFALASDTQEKSRPRAEHTAGKAVFSAALLLFAGMNAGRTLQAVRSRDVYPYLVMKSTRLRDLGFFLQKHYPRESLLALRRQGAVPYISHMPTVDIMGLTDAGAAEIIYRERDIIERNNTLADYILSRKPDLILLFSSSRVPAGYAIDKSRPSDRLYHIEFVLYRKAVQKEYDLTVSLPLGKTEKAHLLTRRRKSTEKNRE